MSLLDEGNKENLLLIMKQIIIYSMSTLFNLIDEGGDIEDISLILDNEVINIDLQNYFLAYIEDETSCEK